MNCYSFLKQIYSIKYNSFPSAMKNLRIFNYFYFENYLVWHVIHTFDMYVLSSLKNLEIYK